MKVHDTLDDLPRKDADQVLSEFVELLEHTASDDHQSFALFPPIDLTRGAPYLAMDPPGTYSMKMQKCLSVR
jgi:hypothetical protein